MASVIVPHPLNGGHFERLESGTPLAKLRPFVTLSDGTVRDERVGVAARGTGGLKTRLLSRAEADATVGPQIVGVGAMRIWPAAVVEKFPSSADGVDPSQRPLAAVTRERIATVARADSLPPIEPAHVTGLLTRDAILLYGVIFMTLWLVFAHGS